MQTHVNSCAVGQLERHGNRVTGLQVTTVACEPPRHGQVCKGPTCSAVFLYQDGSKSIERAVKGKQSWVSYEVERKAQGHLAPILLRWRISLLKPSAATSTSIMRPTPTLQLCSRLSISPLAPSCRSLLSFSSISTCCFLTTTSFSASLKICSN